MNRLNNKQNETERYMVRLSKEETAGLKIIADLFSHTDLKTTLTNLIDDALFRCGRSPSYDASMVAALSNTIYEEENE